MSRCDECGKQENMPYQCRHCGGTFCAEHRLPENHDCPGLNDWQDPGGVFDSGFDDSVVDDGDDGGIAARLGFDGPGGPLGYFRGNMTYVFLGLMWITFAAQLLFRLATGLLPLTEAAVLNNPGAYRLYTAIFVLTPHHPEYVWTWFTSIFAHGGFGHIALNSIVIYFFGRLVEDYVGSRDFTLLFLGSGAVAGLGQVGLTIAQNGGIPTGLPIGGVLGASGAGLAIMGVLTVLNPGLRVYLYFILPVPLWLLTVGYTGWTVYQIFAVGAGAGGTAQVAHLVGLVIGLAYGQHVKGRHRVPNQLQFGAGGRGPGGPGGPGGGRF